MHPWIKWLCIHLALWASICVASFFLPLVYVVYVILMFGFVALSPFHLMPQPIGKMFVAALCMAVAVIPFALIARGWQKRKSNGTRTAFMGMHLLVSYTGLAALLYVGSVNFPFQE